jgi:hypothetical protein
MTDWDGFGNKWWWFCVVLKLGHFGKNIVLEKYGDQLYRSCEKWWSTTNNQGGKGHPSRTKRRKSNWTGHILRRNYRLTHIIEGNIKRREAKGRRGRRRKQLLEYIKKTREYWKLKEEALDRTLRRTRFGRGYGPVAKQTTCCTLLSGWGTIPECAYRDRKASVTIQGGPRLEPGTSVTATQTFSVPCFIKNHDPKKYAGVEVHFHWF